MIYIKNHLTPIVLVLAAITIITVIIFMNKDEKTQTITKLPGSEFISTYNHTPGAVLVDVRTPDEYTAGHIKGAINIDYYAQDFENNIAKLDKTKAYFIYCHSGNRSGHAASIMNDAGINTIYDLQGGIGGNPQLLSQ